MTILCSETVPETYLSLLLIPLCKHHIIKRKLSYFSLKHKEAGLKSARNKINFTKSIVGVTDLKKKHHRLRNLILTVWHVVVDLVALFWVAIFLALVTYG